MITAIRYFLSEAVVSLWRGRQSTLLSIVTIATALFVLGGFLVVASNLERVLANWRSAAEFSVYLSDTITPGEQEAIDRTIAAAPIAAGHDYVSKWDALSRFRRDFPELAGATRGSAENPLPASFEVRLKQGGVEGLALDRLARQIALMPGVTDVRYDRRWLDRLVSVASLVRWAGIGLAAILILTAALTVTNVVRLAFYARRDEIEIMELVGAPMAFIRGPFVCEGILQGGIGAVVALVALRLLLGFASGHLAAAGAGLIGPDAIMFMPASTALLVVFGGMLVGCIGGTIAARRLQ